MRRSCCLPARQFADRSTWNSVGQIEKAGDSQLAREIESSSAPRTVQRTAAALVRAYVKDNFVDKGCALTSPSTIRATPCSYHADRPAPENGAWGKVPQGIRPGRKRPAYPGRERRLEEPPGGHHRLGDKGMWRFGGRHGRPAPTGHWRPPVIPPW